jgi:hypothetical protein
MPSSAPDLFFHLSFMLFHGPVTQKMSLIIPNVIIMCSTSSILDKIKNKQTKEIIWRKNLCKRFDNETRQQNDFQFFCFVKEWN